eukprot:g12334.t1
MLPLFLQLPLWKTVVKHGASSRGVVARIKVASARLGGVGGVVLGPDCVGGVGAGAVGGGPGLARAFRPAEFGNRIPSAFIGFVDGEVETLIARGCVTKWQDVRGPDGAPDRPRFLCNAVATHSAGDREQWLAACEGTRVAVLVSYLRGVFLSAKKCDWRPTRVQKYLGILCDSGTATFRIPQEKLDVVHSLLTEALENRTVAFRTLQRIAGKVTSMTVAIRPGSLYTQAMFAALAMLEKTTQRVVDLSLDSSANLVGELKQWLSISAITREGPWQLAQHFTAALTKGASDASSVAWGGVVYTAGDPFEARGVFPAKWLAKHIISTTRKLLVGHIVQRLAECRAHAVVLVPGVKAYWFPRVQSAAVRSVEIAAVKAAGVFKLPSSDGRAMAIP